MLRKILTHMIHNVELSGAPQKRTLKNKLTIELQPGNNNYTIILSRENVYPSSTEWNTVMIHFPYPIIIPSYKQYDTGDKYCLSGIIPKQEGE